MRITRPTNMGGPTHQKRGLAMIQAPATLTGLDQGDGSEPPNLNQARIKTQKQREEHPDR